MGLDDATIKKLRELRANKVSLSEIQKQTGISKPTIIKYTKDVEIKKPKSTDAQNLGSMIESSAGPRRPEVPIEDYDIEFIDSVDGSHEAVIDVKGFPINRKLSLTAKNVTLWDCFKRVYPDWDGDISDFVNESMDLAFKALKLEMKITIGGVLS